MQGIRVQPVYANQLCNVSYREECVYGQSDSSGVGLTPIDDVFLVHGAATQQALAKYPRHVGPACEVTV